MPSGRRSSRATPAARSSCPDSGIRGKPIRRAGRLTSLQRSLMPPVYLGEFEHLLLLAILRLGPEAFGVEIARELDQRAGRRVSRGALYTSLDRLEDKGLLKWKLAA